MISSSGTNRRAAKFPRRNNYARWTNSHSAVFGAGCKHQYRSANSLKIASLQLLTLARVRVYVLLGVVG